MLTYSRNSASIFSPCVAGFRANGAGLQPESGEHVHGEANFTTYIFQCCRFVPQQTNRRASTSRCLAFSSNSHLTISASYRHLAWYLPDRSLFHRQDVQQRFFGITTQRGVYRGNRSLRRSIRLTSSTGLSSCSASLPHLVRGPVYGTTRVRFAVNVQLLYDVNRQTNSTGLVHIARSIVWRIHQVAYVEKRKPVPGQTSLPRGSAPGCPLRSVQQRQTTIAITAGNFYHQTQLLSIIRRRDATSPRSARRANKLLLRPLTVVNNQSHQGKAGRVQHTLCGSLR